MTYLVDKADAIGAIPILVSNGVRQSKYNSGGGYYRDNVCEHIKSISGLAFEEQLPLVDLYSMATDNLNTLGSIEATTKYYMVFKEADYADDPKFENSQYNDGDDTEDAQNDTTHTRVLGAQTAAGFVAKGLSMIDSISEYVK